MRLTPAYLTAVATFYDMLETRPVGRHTRLRLHEHLLLAARRRRALRRRCSEAAGEDPDFNVRAFECLGACDIAPMASVDGEYVGPLELADAARIVEDLRAGREVLPEKQLSKRACADPGAARSAAVHARPEAESRHRDAGLDAPRRDLT